MNQDELDLVLNLGQCYSSYIRLVDETDYPARDQVLGEFASRIHDLQARVMWLAARREHPDQLT